MSEGWKCSECGRVFAPSVIECPYCPSSKEISECTCPLEDVGTGGMCNTCGKPRSFKTFSTTGDSK